MHIGAPNTNEDRYFRICYYVVVDGGWSDWKGWGACDVSCGWGSQFRNRVCDYPTPSCKGGECKGKHKEHRECDAGSCPGIHLFQS